MVPIRRLAIVLCVLTPAVLQGQQPPSSPLSSNPAVPQRAIRRDVPLSNSIRHAYDAGTRDLTGRPGPKYWQQQVDYSIDAKLDPATDTITGSETVTLHNNSPQELSEIVLRLDHNIFRGLVPRGESVPAENTDGMVLTRLSVNGDAADLAAPGGGRRGAAAGARRLSAYNLDQTVAHVTLPTPIAAKTNATLQIDWHTKLPGGPGGRGHRMTQRWGHDLYQPAQWYPRVSVYDDLRGWDTNPYLGPSEFYNNFGRFDVRVNVPAGWIVTGTGVLQNPQEVFTDKARERLTHVLDSDQVITIVGPDEKGPGQSTQPGEQLTWHYVADMVNDFAWLTASNLELKATRATIPGKGPIPIYLAYQPDHEAGYANAGPIARHALEFYSTLWAPYPFPQFTLQDGPDNGMEYPMVINSNQGPADHETGHQWWPMVVSNNETMYGWMDEGFNQYMNILSDADARKTPARLNGRGQSYGPTSGSEDEPAMMWSANYSGSMYGFQTYGKTPLMLSMLGGIVGDSEVQRAMSEYAKAWAFKHPSPWDYIFFMDKALGRDLQWFWYYWLWTTDSVDGSIASVTANGGKTIVTVRQDGQMPSPIVLKVKLAGSGPAVKPMANAKMLDDTTAIVNFPVDVWFIGNRAFQATLDFGGRAVESIVLDPDGRFPDKDTADNVWPRK